MRPRHPLATLALVLSSIVPSPAAEDPPIAREAVCRRVATPPTIDGVLDDAAWKAAEADAITEFASFWAGQPRQGARATLVWDDDALYFAATLTDVELRAHGTKRNDMLWLGDVFELFFKPSDADPRYYEFQVNPRSVILELAFPRRGHSFEELAARPPMGFSAVAVVDGTLDSPGDADRSWRVEGRIPWSLTAPPGGRPAEGDVWRFALCSYDYGPDGTEPVLFSSAPLTVPNYHRYEDYGRLRFAGSGN